jgi:hypothetical protein
MTDIASEESVDAVARRAVFSGHSAVLCAEVSGDVGYLFFLKGELVHASSLELEGEAAAAEILCWREARLSWCERRWPNTRSITKDVSELLRQPPPMPVDLAGPLDVEDEPPPESQARPATTSPRFSSEPRFPTATGVSRALLGAGFKNALCVSSAGLVGEARGNYQHLKAIVHGSALLGDLFGTALGVGPLIAAEISSTGFHRVLARSGEGGAAGETVGGNALVIARAFLKL